MAKAPAFQFYPDRFMGLSGVMSPLETHVYVWLLCLDWNQSGFVENERELARWCRITVPEFRKAWPAVRRCFQEREGRVYDPHLEKERIKQTKWREKSSAGGKKSAESRKRGSTTLEASSQPTADIRDSILGVSKTTKTSSRRHGRAHDRATWLTPVGEVWEARFGAGTFGWGEAAARLRPIADHYEPSVIAEHLRRYLSRTDAKYVSLTRFAQTFADYGPADASALVDEFGQLTPECEKQTRPGMVP